MRLLIACDKFKGSLTAEAACEAVRRGLTDEWQVKLSPIADGGEGFLAAMLSAAGGERIQIPSLDPLGRPVDAEYGVIRANGQTTAVIEMAAASGLALLAPCERQIRRASSFGSGLLMRQAVEQSGATKLIVGIGGSATNDGGAGIAAALRVRFLDEEGTEFFPDPESLEKLEAIDESARIDLPEVIVACDVDNPLTGPRGASAVFGPQKGATVEDIAYLDRVLARLAGISGAADLADRPGAGAAGGAGFGLLRFMGATLRPGFEIVAEASGLLERIAASDLVITGEGSLDSQTLGGKGPHGIAIAASRAGVPVVAIAGRAEPGASAIFDAVISLEETGLPQDVCISRASELIAARIRAHAGLLMTLASR